MTITRAGYHREELSGTWTDARVDVLKKLWRDGLSCSQIAKQLGGTTRNAVIGKVNRLGLPGRDTPRQPARAPKVIRPPVSRPATLHPQAKARAPKPAPAPKPKFAIAGNGAVFEQAPREPMSPPLQEPAGLATLLTLGRHMCKWPIGDPLQPGFTFCGKKTERTYCEAHAELAFVAPKPLNIAAANQQRRCQTLGSRRERAA